MYVYIYTYTYIYICAHIYIYIHTHIYTYQRGLMGLLDPCVGERKRGRQCWLRPSEWASLPRREWPHNSTSQITSPLNGPVIFFEEFECRRLRVGQFRWKRAKSPLSATQDGEVKKLEDDV